MEPLEHIPVGTDVTKLISVKHVDEGLELEKNGDNSGSFPGFIPKTDEGQVIQGEIAGPKIQKNRLQLPELEFFVFNVLKFDEKLQIRHLNYTEMSIFCLEKFLPMIPVEKVVSEQEVGQFDWTLKNFLDLAEGKYDSGFQKEGIVVRPCDIIHSPRLNGPLSFKVINNNFLLEGK